ncbi:MAG TPA: hypothetical protein VFJ18_00705, partial [Pararhizobium sp.]|nr:hypothetical protein [Pararhizobium sp.]
MAEVGTPAARSATDDGNTIVIEYLLVFALGFCVALFIGLVVAPMIRRRIVILTERRMRATVALSTAEVRAEKDAARAIHAMENRRLSVALTAERGRRNALAIEKANVVADLAGERDASSALRHQLGELADEGDVLRTRLREEEEATAELQASLAGAERLGEARAREIQDLTATIGALTRERDESKIDIAARDTQIETLKSQIGVLRDERNALRDEMKAAVDTASDLRMRLEREEERIAGLDEKLSVAIAERSDREGELERRTGDIQRLRERLDQLAADAASANAAREESDAKCRMLEEELFLLRGTPADQEPDASESQEAEAMNGNARENPAITRRIEKLRKRHATLMGALAEPGDG